MRINEVVIDILQSQAKMIDNTELHKKYASDDLNIS